MDALKFYSRKDIQEAILESAKDKEIAIKFGNNGFGKRPDILKYPMDILELAKKGATSFHCSEEIWENPLDLKTGISKKEMDQIRKGWDLLLDIDCTWLEYSKITGDLLVKALQYHNIKNVFVKFSGNHGFHICIPFECFPEKFQNKETKLLFPEAPKKIAIYLKELIRDQLADQIIELDSLDGVIKKTGKSFDEIIKNNKFDPYEILEIDTILLASRHLYRMPYSFNEKSGLISIPIHTSKILTFNKEDAHPNKIKETPLFVDKSNISKNEARQLLVQSYDFSVEEHIEIPKEQNDYEEITQAIPEELFPPCIKNIFKGLKDGRKRAVFTLINFLSSVGWPTDKIEKKLEEWNEKNIPSLKEIHVKGQLNYFKRKNKKVLPGNCSNENYYQGIGICTPDNLCSKIKNPVNYAVRKARYINSDKKEKKSDKQKSKKDNINKNTKKQNTKTEKKKEKKETKKD